MKRSSISSVTLARRSWNKVQKLDNSSMHLRPVSLYFLDVFRGGHVPLLDLASAHGSRLVLLVYASKLSIVLQFESDESEPPSGQGQVRTSRKNRRYW